MADEAISDFTKEVDGKTVPMWSREEIDEIIIAQVCFCLNTCNTPSRIDYAPTSQ